jgi:hypothetical protein
MKGLIALFYGVLLAWGGWNGYQASGNRFLLIGGGGLGGLAALGGLLMILGLAAGQGLALLAIILATLYFGWSLSDAIRLERPAARTALITAGGAAVLAVLIGGCGPASPPTPDLTVPTRPAQPIEGIEEASGVVRIEDALYVVGDHEAATIYRLPLRPEDIPAPGTAASIALDPQRLEEIRWPDTESLQDLEAVGQLADGRMVVLSEDQAAIADQKGPVVSYGSSMQEVGGRGLEGLAVRALADGTSRIAVLWEGGYPGGAAPTAAFRPALQVYDLPSGKKDRTLTAAEAMLRVELETPLPAGTEPWAQRFRAPDLVWYRFPGPDGSDSEDGVWGFLVLLSSGWGQRPEAGSAAECDESEDGAPRRYCHKWVQRFTVDGQPFGEPWDIEPQLPDDVRFSNVEGMGWFESGESVVLVYDERVMRRAVDPQIAVVLPLPAGG